MLRSFSNERPSSVAYSVFDPSCTGWNKNRESKPSQLKKVKKRLVSFLRKTIATLNMSRDWCHFVILFPELVTRRKINYSVLVIPSSPETGGGPWAARTASPQHCSILEQDVHKFYTNTQFQKEIGWHVPGILAKHLIVGLQHVDDAVVASKVLCEKCLERGTEKMWPNDVGTSLEEKGPTIIFMATTIAIFPNHHFEVYPTPVNIDFTRGLSEHPKSSRLPFFQGPEHHVFDMYEQFIIGRIVNINMLSRGSLLHAIPACAVLFGDIPT
jgi:hypothetical protein